MSTERKRTENSASLLSNEDIIKKQEEYWAIPIREFTENFKKNTPFSAEHLAERLTYASPEVWTEFELLADDIQVELEELEQSEDTNVELLQIQMLRCLLGIHSFHAAVRLHSPIENDLYSEAKAYFANSFEVPLQKITHYSDKKNDDAKPAFQKLAPTYLHYLNHLSDNKADINMTRSIYITAFLEKYPRINDWQKPATGENASVIALLMLGKHYAKNANDASAILAYRKAASLGSIEACVILAEIYQKKADITQAEIFYNLAEKQGHIAAYFRATYLSDHEKERKDNNPKSFSAIQEVHDELRAKPLSEFANDVINGLSNADVLFRERLQDASPAECKEFEASLNNFNIQNPGHTLMLAIFSKRKISQSQPFRLSPPEINDLNHFVKNQLQNPDPKNHSILINAILHLADYYENNSQLIHAQRFYLLAAQLNNPFAIMKLYRIENNWELCSDRVIDPFAEISPKDSINTQIALSEYYYYSQEPGKKDEAIRVLKEAAFLGSVEACATLAVIFMNEKDQNQAHEFRELAISRKNIKACNLVLGSSKDTTYSASLYHKMIMNRRHAAKDDELFGKLQELQQQDKKNAEIAFYVADIYGSSSWKSFFHNTAVSNPSSLVNLTIQDISSTGTDLSIYISIAAYQSYLKKLLDQTVTVGGEINIGNTILSYLHNYVIYLESSPLDKAIDRLVITLTSTTMITDTNIQKALKDPVDLLKKYQRSKDETHLELALSQLAKINQSAAKSHWFTKEYNPVLHSVVKELEEITKLFADLKGNAAGDSKAVDRTPAPKRK